MNCTSSNRRARMRGLTLIETTMGLVIAGALFASVLALMQVADSTQRASGVAVDAMAIDTTMTKLRNGLGTYGNGDRVEALLAARYVPATLVTGTGATLLHPFGGAVTVTGADSFYYIAIQSLDNDTCIEIATNAGPWAAITVDSVPDAATFTESPLGPRTLANTVSPAVTPARASSLCRDGNKTVYLASR